jgi:hypothetical protein
VTDVKPGQLWGGRLWANTERRIRIHAVNDRYAEVYGWREDSTADGRNGRILLDQIPKRYSLISDAPEVTS